MKYMVSAIPDISLKKIVEETDLIISIINKGNNTEEREREFFI